MILTRQTPTRTSRATLILTGLLGFLICTIIFSIGIGAVKIEPLQVLGILARAIGLDLGIAFESQQEAVMLIIRLPRVLLGILVGAALALSGAVMQGLFRNPLADPGLIGVSSGAALAAVAMIVLGVTVFNANNLLALPVAAFAGGLATTLLVYRVLSQNGRVMVGTMLLAGIAIAALSGAATGLLTFVATDAQLRSITFWSLGSLGGATWETLGVAAPFLVLTLLIMLRFSRALNAFTLGEAEAGHLGVDVERIKLAAIVVTALAVGAAVSVVGIIGFVGLIVPHLLRISLGADHRFLLPGCILLGSSLLLCADLIARTIVAPAELPIGIVTALLGAPFFLWMLIKSRQVGA